MSGYAGGVDLAATLQRRAPGQSEAAINGNRGNITIAVAAAASVAASILLALM